MDSESDPPPPPLTLPGSTPLKAESARWLLEDALSTPDHELGGASWTPPGVEELRHHFAEYRISRMIGRGGMGAVYLGTDPDLGRPVAIKLLPAELSCLPSFSDRFRREAWALAQLQHPHIVQIHQFGTTPDGHLYFVMEYVAGANLAEQLDQRLAEHPNAAPFKPGEVLKVAGQVCAALSGAHAQGILHRDIKPANLLMDGTGHLKLADFGLARPVETQLKAGGVTASNTVIGTRDYMAPELLDGGDTDARADVYAVGVLLYEMLTGTLPRGAYLPPSRFQKMDRKFDQIVAQAMQADRTRRFASIDALQAALETMGPREGLPRRPWRPVAAGLVLTGLGGGAFAWQNRGPAAGASGPSFPPAGPDLIWEESFDLPAGKNGLNQSSRFAVEFPSPANGDITPEGLGYTDADGVRLRSRGRAASLDATQLTTSLSYTAALDLPAGPPREMWISLLARQTAGTSYRFFNLCLRAPDDTIVPPDNWASADEVLAIGMRSQKGPQVWQIWDRTTQGDHSRAAVSSSPTTQTAFLLIRLELDAEGPNERTTLWINPPLTRPPDESDGFAFTSYQSNLTQWNELRQIRLGAGYGSGTLRGTAWTVDEIRLGWTRAAVTPTAGPVSIPDK